MDVDVAERHVVHELQAHHDHPGDPEEDDVEARDQDRGRIKGPQPLGVLGPAEGTEGPERGAEPGVEHVRVLLQRKVGRQRVGVAHLLLGAADIDIALGVVPGRNTVTPPDLTADAPVLDVAHPLEIGVLPVVRHEADAPVLHRGDGGLRQGGGAHVPLVREPGLDDGPGAVPARDHELVVLDAGQEPLGLQVRDDPLACLVAVEPHIGGGDQLTLFGEIDADGRIRGEHVDEAAMGLTADRQLVPVTQPDLVVVEVVGRGDLDAAGAEGGVRVLVGDDGDAPAGQRQLHQLADQVLVALVLRVHRDRAVPEQGLGAGGRDHQGASPVGEGIAHVPHVAGLLLGEHLQVRDRRVQHRVPVDQALSPVDQALLIEPDEDLADRRRESLVHGEALVSPVQGGPQAPELAGDVSTGLGLPLPDARDEGIPAQVVAGLALGLQLTLHDHLGGDARVVGPRLPEGPVPFHPVIADEGVHHRVVEPVPHVQATRHVGRGDHDAVASVPIGFGGGGVSRAGGEVALLFPALVPVLLEGLGIVVLVQHGLASRRRGGKAKSIPCRLDWRPPGARTEAPVRSDR